MSVKGTEMKLWYCLECGNYQFTEPKTKKDELGNIWMCPLCGEISIIDMCIQSPLLSAMNKRLDRAYSSKRFVDYRPQYRPLNYLLEAINGTRSFIHIVSESMDRFFLGMLSMKFFNADDIEIRIIVWHHPRGYADLAALWKHSKILRAYHKIERPLIRGIIVETIPQAHQKLIILDGCVAFKGSANATLAGWTTQGNLIEFSANPTDIQALNQEFFSRFMANKINQDKR
jgi:hypothetical protein